MSELPSPPQEISQAHIEKERSQNAEIAFVGVTFVPRWSENEDTSNADRTRGNQVLENVKNLLSWGYKVVIIDGGSSPAFLTKLDGLCGEDATLRSQLTMHVDPEGNSLSEAQRKGYEVASNLSGTKVIMTTQPEKPFTESDLYNFTRPILHGEADMVIPYRTSHLRDYPPEQEYFENMGNLAMSEALQQAGFLEKGVVLDIYNGTRIIRNDPDLLALLSTQYDESMLDFYHRLPKERTKRFVNVFRRLLRKKEHETLRQFLDPDKWFAALYGPVAAFAVNGKKIVSVESDYQHPQEQTQQETGNPFFDRKRYQQYMAIVPYFYDYLIYLIGQNAQRN